MTNLDSVVGLLYRVFAPEHPLRVALLERITRKFVIAYIVLTLRAQIFCKSLEMYYNEQRYTYCV